MQPWLMACATHVVLNDQESMTRENFELDVNAVG